MARRQAQSAEASSDNGNDIVKARALVDIPALGVLCGRLFSASRAEVAARIESGEADDSLEAVAYAESLEPTEVK